MIRIEPLNCHGTDAADALLDAAFGTDRRARAAYAIRRGMAWFTHLSYAAVDTRDGQLAGLLQSWPVALCDDAGGRARLIMIGPVAVHPGRQTQGIGRALMDRLIADVEREEHDPLMMIGDEPYYGRFWQFLAAPTQGWDIPAGVDPARLLARRASERGAAIPASGRLGPRIAIVEKIVSGDSVSG